MSVSTVSAPVTCAASGGVVGSCFVQPPWFIVGVNQPGTRVLFGNLEQMYVFRGDPEEASRFEDREDWMSRSVPLAEVIREEARKAVTALLEEHK